MKLICNFTDLYTKRGEWAGEDRILVDFRDMEGTNGYCSDEAAGRIMELLKPYPPSGEHYIDDGNHHYMTRFWIEKIKEPFDLIVFDHHTDMQPPALLPILSCGNWILESVNSLENLKNILLVGPPQSSLEEIESFKDRVFMISEENANEAPEEALNGAFAEFCGRNNGLRPVYISVDEDVLSESEVKTIWDQGSMTRKTLNSWIGHIKDNFRVIGIDICG
ncbi:MAG: arginase family protein [Lachnospiraceae bacterium]|nr:arginase family protein [Lachnospiraceae bacterium]